MDIGMAPSDFRPVIRRTPPPPSPQFNLRRTGHGPHLSARRVACPRLCVGMWVESMATPGSPDGYRDGTRRAHPRGSAVLFEQEAAVLLGRGDLVVEGGAQAPAALAKDARIGGQVVHLVVVASRVDLRR